MIASAKQAREEQLRLLLYKIEMCAADGRIDLHYSLSRETVAQLEELGFKVVQPSAGSFFKKRMLGVILW